MEYERIHKVQTGVISPSKLRIKLIGSPNLQKKNDGSNSSSSRTSPSSRLEDSKFVKNSLLAAQDGEEEEAPSSEVPPIQCGNSSQGDVNSLQSKELTLMHNAEANQLRLQPVSKSCEETNPGAFHPVRSYDDENLDYDSTSSFEFHKGERSLHHSLSRPFSRPMPSKWNDAEKWIMNRQNLQLNNLKKINVLNQVNRLSAMNVDSENKLSVKRVDLCHVGIAPSSVHVNGGNGFVSSFSESKDLREVDRTSLVCTTSVAGETPVIRSVSMRDTGTEMTPIPSQEPSRSTTPVDATTPLRTPTSSVPSSPRKGQPTQDSVENEKKELSEQEQKHKTRREIIDLGVQLGKLNIAAWASKDEKEKSFSGNKPMDLNELDQIEYVKRAAAWEEAEKSKHAARFKREEIRIQAWESQQKAKLEAEMRQIEAQIEQMRAQAQAKMVKKIALARQKSEEKRAVAEARKNKLAEKAAAQADYIRQTGRIPSTYFSCCGWF